MLEWRKWRCTGREVTSRHYCTFIKTNLICTKLLRTAAVWFDDSVNISELSIEIEDRDEARFGHIPTFGSQVFE